MAGTQGAQENLMVLRSALQDGGVGSRDILYFNDEPCGDDKAIQFVLKDESKWKFDTSTQSWIKSSSVTQDDYAEYTYRRIWVDVNGDRAEDADDEYHYLNNVEILDFVGSEGNDVIRGGDGKIRIEVAEQATVDSIMNAGDSLTALKNVVGIEWTQDRDYGSANPSDSNSTLYDTIIRSTESNQVVMVLQDYSAPLDIEHFDIIVVPEVV